VPPGRHRPVALAVLTALAVAAGGCRIRDREPPPEGDDEELTAVEQEIVDDSGDLEGAERHGSSIAAIPTLGLLGARGPITLAQAVELQDQIGVRTFLPAGCATAQTAGNVVTYDFDRCTGPLGLIELSGTLTATFRPGRREGSISVTMATEAMTIDGVPIQHQAEVVVTFAETGKRIEWTGSFTGRSPRGHAVEHTSALVVDVDEEARCATTSGTASGRVDGRGVDVVYTDFMRCAPIGSCPSGTIAATGARGGLTLTVELDGSDVAVVTTPEGREVEIDLVCTPIGEGR
jgi:hypothetical protein